MKGGSGDSREDESSASSTTVREMRGGGVGRGMEDTGKGGERQSMHGETAMIVVCCKGWRECVVLHSRTFFLSQRCLNLREVVQFWLHTWSTQPARIWASPH